MRLLGEKHGVKGRDLAQVVRRTGRRLPKGLRAQAAVLIEAEKLAAIPKLSRRIDAAAVGRAEQVLKAHLELIDVKERRKGRALSLAGTIAAQVLLISAAFITWLWWRDYI
jgi:hypothetical protein